MMNFPQFPTTFPVVRPGCPCGFPFTGVQPMPLPVFPGQVGSPINPYLGAFFPGQAPFQTPVQGQFPQFQGQFPMMNPGMDDDMNDMFRKKRL